VLIRKSERTARQGRLTAALSGASTGVDRRAFLRRSGLAAGALAAVGA
jgi:formate dehydrogenase major subunit